MSLPTSGVQLVQHTPEGTKVPFMLKEESLDSPLRPELHCIGKHLKRHFVATQVVSYKHDSFHSLGREEGMIIACCDVAIMLSNSDMTCLATM